MELSQGIRETFQKETEEQKRQYISKLRTGKIKKIPLQERLLNSTSYKLAEITGLGTASVDKGNYIIDHGTPEEIDSLRNKEISLEEAYRTIVNRRHADPNITKRSDRVFPICSNCGSPTRFKGKCHVHSHYCCKKCSWGN